MRIKLAFPKIPYEGIFNDADNYPYNINGLPPIHWSPDNRYVYFTRHDCCWDYAPSYDEYGLNVDQQGDMLYQLDVLSGTYRQFVGWADDYSFSPTGRRLVYIQWASITVRDLKTGEESEYRPEGYAAALHVVWSEDGTRFVFVATRSQQHGDQWGCPYYFDYTLFLADMSTGTLTPLYTYVQSGSEVIPLEWGADDVITIRIADNYCQEGNQESVQFFDLNIGQFIEPTPIP